ncbi:head protein, partial [Acinetobacter baumannii]
NMDSPSVFMEGVFLFGAEARGNGGYGFWQTIYGSTGTEA